MTVSAHQIKAIQELKAEKDVEMEELKIIESQEARIKKLEEANL